MSDSQPAALAACKEVLQVGSLRPALKEQIATQSTAGYTLNWTLTVTHPKGLHPAIDGLNESGELRKKLRSSGFGLPKKEDIAELHVESADASAGANLAVSSLTLALIPLPARPGTQTLTVPSLPLTLERASGEQFVLCTESHAVVVHDPTEGASTKTPRENPAYRPQFETFLSFSAILAIAALVSVVLAGFWFYKKKKNQAPASAVALEIVDQRPPWEVAHAELLALDRGSKDMDAKPYADALSDIVRSYLGARYRIPGIEATSPELLQALQGRGLPRKVEDALQKLLEETDLVKFANLAELERERGSLLDSALSLVESTKPAPDPGFHANPQAAERP
jgi:hypothetical protein